MVPRLLGAAVVAGLNFLVNTILASAMPEGSISAISYALAIMLMPQLVIAQSIAVAFAANLLSAGGSPGVGRPAGNFGNTLRSVLFLAIPASLGMILLRQPIVAMLLERGDFTTQSTNLVAWALLWYAAGLVGHAVLEVIVRAFYAMYDTRTPVMVGARAMALMLPSACFSHVGSSRWMGAPRRISAGQLVGDWARGGIVADPHTQALGRSSKGRPRDRLGRDGALRRHHGAGIIRLDAVGGCAAREAPRPGWNPLGGVVIGWRRWC